MPHILLGSTEPRQGHPRAFSGMYVLNYAEQTRQREEGALARRLEPATMRRLQDMLLAVNPHANQLRSAQAANQGAPGWRIELIVDPGAKPAGKLLRRPAAHDRARVPHGARHPHHHQRVGGQDQRPGHGPAPRRGGPSAAAPCLAADCCALAEDSAA